MWSAETRAGARARTLRPSLELATFNTRPSVTRSIEKAETTEETKNWRMDIYDNKRISFRILRQMVEERSEVGMDEVLRKG